MMTRPILLPLLLTASLAAFSLPAAALPSAADKPVTKAPRAKSPKALKCNRNETAKRMTRKGRVKYVCVKLKAGVSSDADLYQQARALADAHEYEWALDHLRLISNQQDPDVLTYSGYAHRKAGRLETGISYYQQALALKPDYAEAREYLGEAYVLAGDNARATAQLLAIKNICGTGCESYRALSAFIAKQQP